MSKKKILGAAGMLVVIVVLMSATVGREIVAGRTPTLTSFALIHFAGYLFFLLMPVEALVPYYLAEGHPGGLLVILSVVTALIAQGIDFWIGWAVSGQIIHDLIGAERYAKFKGYIDRWGAWAIFIFNLFPLSSPNMLLVSGMVRFHPIRALLISMSGLTLKYLALVYVFGVVT